jgi:hypothetical protein
MAANNCDEKLVSLVRTSPTATIHLVTSNGTTGMVFFACEHAPFLTFQSHGFPARCPVCGKQNPLKGEQARNE